MSTVMRKARTWLAAGLVVLGAGIAGTVHAADVWPVKPVSIVVPISTGSTVDIVARLFADRLSQRLGQTFVVQNRPGAGGTIAAQTVAKAPADGYTIMLVNSQHAINPSLYTSLPYDTARDFAGVVLVAQSPALVVVNPVLGVRNLREFIALARERPGFINYGSAGIGTATHLAGALFANRAGVELVHVPYKAMSDLIADVVTGRTQVTFVPTAFLLSQIREGKLQALAVTSREALKAPLEVPSAGESGLPGFEYVTWYGFIAHARTPRPVITQLASTIRSIATSPEMREALAAQGLEARDTALGDFDALIRADLDKIAPLMKAIGTRPE
jgi:tripartite-type tricarboxylate transporter receptor subunit TctC